MKCSPMSAGMGIALGTGIGAAIGVATGHLASWVAIGAGMGLLIPYFYTPKPTQNADQNPTPKV
jgi:hypothetical protein